jgi:hypothetical protein
MNTQKDLVMPINDDLLDSVERAIAEKMGIGRADEARYGFAARLANATPPVNETFQRALRARILVELTREKNRTMTVRDRVQTTNFWQLSLVGGIILLLIFAASQCVHLWNPEIEAHVPTVASTLPLVSGDVDALANKINEDPAPRTVMVYPGDYAETLAGRIQHQVVPIALDGNLDPTAIQAALGAVLPSSGLVDVIIVNRETTNAAYQVLVALEQRLYRLYRPNGIETETFGTLERNQFIVGPQDAALEPIGAIFEGGIELVAGSVLDDPRSGEPLPMAFDWRVTESVDDSLAMFAHLIHDENRLIAQWDAVPGSEPFPMERWEPGELVRHQFALQLPSELPAGEHEIQVGIYSSTSGMRYSLIEPEGSTYVIVRRFTIEE